MEGPLRYVEDEDEDEDKTKKPEPNWTGTATEHTDIYSVSINPRADDVYRGRVSKGTE
jgi:hypothetical protein